MQKDLQYGFGVLYLRYLSYIEQFYKKGLLARRCGLKLCRLRHRIANKPFFMPARNVGMEAIDGY